MSYLGRSVDKISNIEKLDNITFDGSSSYTLQKGSVNFVPSSAQAILISIDGVVQSGNFTVSGSTIDFGTSVAGTSTCNFIIHLGVGLITAPSDGSVTAAKVADDLISGQTALATEPDDTDEFLVSDAGTLKRIDYSLIKGGGITMIDQFRLSASIAGANHVINANWERPDTGISAQFGSIQMSQSSGIFTFPSTGFYKVDFIAGISYGNVGDNQTNIFTQFTENNSSYANYAVAFAGSPTSSGNSRFTVSSSIIVDITDTSNQKVRFEGTSFANSNTVLEGDTGYNVTTATFTRIGDT